MASKLKTWIGAARLRTLPLSVSGILVGSGIAVQEDSFTVKIFVLAILTTLGLQILSNFANDYGDGIKGTDNKERVGPMRALQSGIITDREMKKAIIITALITFVMALFLILTAFSADQLLYVFVFLGLGIAAIAAAIKYTVGKTAYGYRGLGDLFVFLFFGLLSVGGSHFLYSQALTGFSWGLGAVIGLLSTAVINLNNMRDRESDLKSGKHTLAVKLGPEKAKRYHLFLIIGALLLTVLYVVFHPDAHNLFLFVAFIPLGKHLFTVTRNQDLKTLDPELKKVALSTFLYALIFFGISFL